MDKILQISDFDIDYLVDIYINEEELEFYHRHGIKFDTYIKQMKNYELWEQIKQNEYKIIFVNRTEPAFLFGEITGEPILIKGIDFYNTGIGIFQRKILENFFKKNDLIKEKLIEKDYPLITLEGMEFNNNIENFNFKYSTFKKCRFKDCMIIGDTDIRTAQFYNCEFDNSHIAIKGELIECCKFSKCEFKNTDFGYMKDLKLNNFYRPIVTDLECRYIDILIFGCTFINSMIQGCFEKCDFIDNKFENCKMSKIMLINNDLNNNIFNICSLDYTFIDNNNIFSNKFIYSNFAETVFEFNLFIDNYFERCNLRGANLKKVLFYGGNSLSENSYDFRTKFCKNYYKNFKKNKKIYKTKVNNCGSGYKLKEMLNFPILQKNSDFISEFSYIHGFIYNDYKGSGMEREAYIHYYLHKKLMCKRLLFERRILAYINSRINNIICGYGERPERVVFWMIFTIIITGILFMLTGFKFQGEIINYSIENIVKELKWIDLLKSIYFSMIQFFSIDVDSITTINRLSELVIIAQNIISLMLITIFTSTFIRKLIRD